MTGVTDEWSLGRRYGVALLFVLKFVFKMNFVHICLRNVKHTLKSYVDVVYAHTYVFVQCVIRSTYDSMYLMYIMSPVLVYISGIFMA